MKKAPVIAIIGAGPAGLIAAQMLAARGARVTVYDRMASPARKFLFAGRGGLNLTHSEPLEAFLPRYGAARTALEPMIRAFPPEALRAFAADLGEETFTGSSGRVFPRSFKATPLLRAWLRRLAGLGVTVALQHEWRGFDGSSLRFATPDGERMVQADATLLALGGASWPRLGANGGWVPLLAAKGVAITPLAASNVGITLPWSPAFAERFHGAPLKGCAFACGPARTLAEAVITRTGLEGGALYALSAPLRTALATGAASLTVDLKPGLGEAALAARLAKARPSESLSNVLRKHAGLSPAAIGLAREGHGAALPREPAALARALKAVPLAATGLQGIDRAISTAGGIAFAALDETLQLKVLPGVYAAGEMLDFDAPTGGYLLQAAFATGHHAAQAIAAALTLP